MVESEQKSDFDIDDDKIIEKYGISWMKELKFAGKLLKNFF